MTREDKVISLELAKKLHELGVRVESEWWWFEDETDHEHPMDRETFEFLSNAEYGYDPKDYEIGEDCYPAYDTAELGEMLPYRLRTAITDYWLWCGKLKHGGMEIRYKNPNGGHITPIQGKTEAEARGKMLVWLIENGYVKAEEL